MFVLGKLSKQTELAHHDLHDSNKKPSQAVVVPFRGGSYGKKQAYSGS
jgi:hypothetical protein